MTRFNEWQRIFDKQGIKIDLSLRKVVEGKGAARVLETKYIQTYEKLFKKIPPFQKTYH